MASIHLLLSRWTLVYLLLLWSSIMLIWQQHVWDSVARLCIHICLCLNLKAHRAFSLLRAYLCQQGVVSISIIMMWRASCYQRSFYSHWHSAGILTRYQLERDLSHPLRSNAPSCRIWACNWHDPASIIRHPQHTCKSVSWLADSSV